MDIDTNDTNECQNQSLWNPFAERHIKIALCLMWCGIANYRIIFLTVPKFTIYKISLKVCYCRDTQHRKWFPDAKRHMLNFRLWYKHRNTLVIKHPLLQTCTYSCVCVFVGICSYWSKVCIMVNHPVILCLHLSEDCRWWSYDLYVNPFWLLYISYISPSFGFRIVEGKYIERGCLKCQYVGPGVLKILVLNIYVSWLIL